MKEFISHEIVNQCTGEEEQTRTLLGTNTLHPVVLVPGEIVRNVIIFLCSRFNFFFKSRQELENVVERVVHHSAAEFYSF